MTSTLRPLNQRKLQLRKMCDSKITGTYSMHLQFQNNLTSDVWNRSNGKVNGVECKTPFLIGVAGGTASGKSTVCKRIMEKLGQVDMENAKRQVVCISQDSFYRELTPAEKAKADKGQFNFDHPDAFNDELILSTLEEILAGRKCEIATYDYRSNSVRKDEKTTIYPADVVLFEGILVFYFPKIRDLFHMKLFVDTDSDTRLARRVPRDINERGRDLDQVLNQYMNFVKPAFEEFCFPTKKFADVIIPRGADNTVAIDLIVHHIWDILHGGNGNQQQRTSASVYTTNVAIELIVQHIRDFLNNRVKNNESASSIPALIEQSIKQETASPGRSPVHHQLARRVNSGESAQVSRLH